MRKIQKAGISTRKATYLGNWRKLLAAQGRLSLLKMISMQFKYQTPRKSRWARSLEQWLRVELQMSLQATRIRSLYRYSIRKYLQKMLSLLRLVKLDNKMNHKCQEYQCISIISRGFNRRDITSVQISNVVIKTHIRIRVLAWESQMTL